MAFLVGDRVRQKLSAPVANTDTVIPLDMVAGRVVGYVPFAGNNQNTGDAAFPIRYVIEEGATWEIGEGYIDQASVVRNDDFTAVLSANFVRTQVIKSYNPTDGDGDGFQAYTSAAEIFAGMSKDDLPGPVEGSDIPSLNFNGYINPLTLSLLTTFITPFPLDDNSEGAPGKTTFNFNFGGFAQSVDCNGLDVAVVTPIRASGYQNTTIYLRIFNPGVITWAATFIWPDGAPTIQHGDVVKLLSVGTPYDPRHICELIRLPAAPTTPTTLDTLNCRPSFLTFSGGDLTVAPALSDFGFVYPGAVARSLSSKATGKAHVEVLVNADIPTDPTKPVYVGLTSLHCGVEQYGFSEQLGYAPITAGLDSNGALLSCTGLNTAQTTLSPTTSVAFATAGDVLAVEIDFDARLMWFRVNAGDWNGDSTADPATGAGGLNIAGLFDSIEPLYEEFVYGGDSRSPLFFAVRFPPDPTLSLTLRFASTDWTTTPSAGFGEWI